MPACVTQDASAEVTRGRAPHSPPPDGTVPAGGAHSPPRLGARAASPRQPSPLPPRPGRPCSRHPPGWANPQQHSDYLALPPPREDLAPQRGFVAPQRTDLTEESFLRSETRPPLLCPSLSVPTESNSQSWGTPRGIPGEAGGSELLAVTSHHLEAR